MIFNIVFKMRCLYINRADYQLFLLNKNKYNGF